MSLKRCSQVMRSQLGASEGREVPRTHERARPGTVRLRGRCPSVGSACCVTVRARRVSAVPVAAVRRLTLVVHESVLRTESRFCMQKCVSLVPGVTLDLIEKIPGRLNDRRTPLGELNWIFTAITDTIAWNVLPRDLFQKLFRQDLLVASLFRNFLLAERIMRSYNCTPVSSPRLPPTYMHAMWQAWDLAVDICLSQLPTIIEEGTAFRHSPFFAEQLTAFQVWLTMGVENRNPPEQLPIVLQVLLSQVHRLRALDLLGRFLDLGPWAVSLALSVGIFPYVLKLLQSSARELRPLLVFIWAKILAVDSVSTQPRLSSTCV
uniref:Regulatory associated protein of MTOR complex 1 n=1 Tax=Oryctolagus cuniculus TaxID=9986 RepID=A0A5F9D9Z3_RABIT